MLCSETFILHSDICDEYRIRCKSDTKESINLQINKMKIFLYINQVSDGGAERAMANLANQFAANSENVVFVTSFRCPVEYELSPNIKRYVLEERTQKSRLLKNVARITKLRRIIKREKPDVAVSFMAEPNFRLLVASIGLPVKKIISVRSDPAKEYAGMIGKILARHLLPEADGCVFQTEDAKNWFSQKLQEKSVIIPNAVNSKFYTTQWRGDGDYIVTLGRLTEVKNHRLMIDAFKTISCIYPKLQLKIYGQGELNSTLEEYINNNGMQDKVFLMGQTQEAEKVLQHAKCFVLSSDFEGMPNALMEAMAVGVPCVSTDCPCGGPRMLLEKGKNGILVPVGDKEKLADAIKLLLENSDLAQGLSHNARKSAEKYTADKICAVWKEYLKI